MATFTDGPTANSTVSGATLAVTGVDAAVGDLLVLACAADNSGASGAISTSTSITDAAGNTWTSRAQTNESGGGVNAGGTTLSVWTCLVTSALTAASITINFSPNTPAKAAAIQRIQPASGCAIVFDAVGPGVNGTGTTHSSGAVDVPLGSTIFGFTSVETSAAITPDSDTTNGTWSTQQTVTATGGSAATSQVLSVQRKTATASGNQTYDTSTAASREYALNYLVVHEETTGSLAATDTADGAAFVTAVATLGTMAAAETQDLVGFVALTVGDRPGVISSARVKSIRILVQFDWPTGAVSRLWDGAGPFVDADGNVWRGCSLAEGIDDLEMAINGEAAALNIALMGVGATNADAVWLSYTNDQIVGAVVRFMIQPCDYGDQPIGTREVVFTGRIDNVIFDDAVVGDRPTSTITAEVTNRFTLRRLENGGVLSDTDQRARSAAFNPDAAPDRFAERVPLLEDRTIAWPKWRS